MMVGFSWPRLLVLAGVLAFPAVSQAQTAAAPLEIDYAVPAGYVAGRQEGAVMLAPQAGTAGANCRYGIKLPRPSRGSLEADAQADLNSETVQSGMRRTNDYVLARRGVAPAGWSYFLLGGNFEAPSPNGSAYLAVMVLVIPTSPGRVSVVLGAGNAAACTFDDVTFAQLFLSLKPRAVASPDGNTLTRDLIGEWQGSSLSGHTFLEDGRYSNSTGGVVFGQPKSPEGGGRYEVRGSEITITPYKEGRPPERFRVYIYDKLNFGRWQRAMAVLRENPATVTEYVRAGQ